MEDYRNQKPRPVQQEDDVSQSSESDLMERQSQSYSSDQEEQYEMLMSLAVSRGDYETLRLLPKWFLRRSTREVCIARYPTIEAESDARIEVASRLRGMSAMDPDFDCAVNFIWGEPKEEQESSDDEESDSEPYGSENSSDGPGWAHRGDRDSDDNDRGFSPDFSSWADYIRRLDGEDVSDCEEEEEEESDSCDQVFSYCPCGDLEMYDGNSYMIYTHLSLCSLQPFEIDSLSLDWSATFTFDVDDYQLISVDFATSLLRLPGKFEEERTFRQLRRLFHEAELVSVDSDPLAGAFDFNYALDCSAIAFYEHDLPQAMVVDPHVDFVSHRERTQDCELTATLDAYKSIGISPNGLLDMQTHPFYLSGELHTVGRQVRSISAYRTLGVTLVPNDEVEYVCGTESIVWVLNPGGATMFYIQCRDFDVEDRWSIAYVQSHVILRHYGNAAALAENRNALMHALNGNIDACKYCAKRDTLPYLRCQAAVNRQLHPVKCDQLCDHADCYEFVIWADSMGEARRCMRHRVVAMVRIHADPPLDGSTLARKPIDLDMIYDRAENTPGVTQECPLGRASNVGLALRRIKHANWRLKNRPVSPRDAVVTDGFQLRELRWQASAVLHNEEWVPSPTSLKRRHHAFIKSENLDAMRRSYELFFGPHSVDGVPEEVVIVFDDYVKRRQFYQQVETCGIQFMLTLGFLILVAFVLYFAYFHINDRSYDFSDR